MPIKGLLKKRNDGAAVTNGKPVNGEKKSNGVKAVIEEKIRVTNAKKRKLEKLQLDLEDSDEDNEDNIAKHIYRWADYYLPVFDEVCCRSLYDDVCRGIEDNRLC